MNGTTIPVKGHGSVRLAGAVIRSSIGKFVSTFQRNRQRRKTFTTASGLLPRRILVDAARARGAHKRGGGAIKVNVDEALVVSPERDSSLVALDEALEAFAKLAPRQAQVVELRYFGGLGEEEIAEVLKTSPRTVRRDWDFAKSWLKRELRR